VSGISLHTNSSTSVVVYALEERQFQREHDQVVLGGGVAESFSLFGGLMQKKEKKSRDNRRKDKERVACIADINLFFLFSHSSAICGEVSALVMLHRIPVLKLTLGAVLATAAAQGVS
jgi:hypothetical protein